MANDIILGAGVFSIGSTPIAVTRGGGQFVVERSYREIKADGDRGPVKDRIVKDESRATLTMRTLEMLTTNLTKLYPATQLDTTVVKTETFKAETDIKTADYNATVKFTGKTMSGKSVVITLENAINLGNIDWALIDKDEVVAEIVYTATYLESARNVEPWKVDFVTP